MRNFKQFLKEDNQEPELDIRILLSTNLTFSEFEILQHDLENEPNIHSIEEDDANGAILVIYNNVPRDKCNLKGLEEYTKPFLEEFENYLTGLEDRRNRKIKTLGAEFILEFKGLPTFYVEVHTIKIIAQEGMVLSGLNKLIKCDVLEIMYCELVKGSVLSLMNLPKKTEIDLQAKGQLPEWALVVNDHLDNRDVLDCQEDLIKYGQKEYAKL